MHVKPVSAKKKLSTLSCYFFMIQLLSYKALEVYTYSMDTIYLYLRAQVAIGTFFMKSPLVSKFLFKVFFLHNQICFPKTSILRVETFNYTVFREKCLFELMRSDEKIIFYGYMKLFSNQKSKIILINSALLPICFIKK